jgi:hypothetical protein
LALSWEATGSGEKEADSSVQTEKARMGPSRGVRVRRVRLSARRVRKTAAADASRI